MTGVQTCALPISIEEASFTDKAIMRQWYGDHDMHTMYVGEIIEVAAR